MRKRLLLVLLLLSFVPLGLRAQNVLFDLETDTACVGQRVKIINHAMNASTYYWGFCSGYLNGTPILEDLGNTFSMNTPTSIETGYDGKNYYGFVTNPSGELLRFNYGKSLNNIPTVTNFGNLDTTVTPSPNSLYLTQDNGKWFLFMVGGGGASPSSVSRFDFGNNLGNVPNGVRMGNPGGLLNDPRGIFVAREGAEYFGFVVNYADSRLIRLNFGNNISNTPTETRVTPISTGGFGGPPPALGSPTDIAAVYDQGFWYFFVTNMGPNNNTVLRLYFGNTLSNTPVLSTAVANSTGGGGGGGGGGNPPVPSKLRGASGLTVLKDCGGYFAYVTNTLNDTMPLQRYNVGSLTTTWTFNTSYITPFDKPTDLSRVVRDRDSLYMFVINTTGGLTKVLFPQCQNASLQSSNLANPPAVGYNAQGIYNIYLAINEGLPNMAVDCKQLYVRAVPPINLSHDTAICQGDTLHVVAGSQYALNYIFSPNYNISDTEGINIKVYPWVPTTYKIRIPYPDGCVVDTFLKVDVSRVNADAGPDRTISDGASTVLGGPNTYLGPQYTYQWFPNQFMDNPFSLNPTVNPHTDLTYYLVVTNTDKCVGIDTVKVKVDCDDIHLPNAFSPDNLRGAPKRFGLMNKQIVQLNYFRIFDRWGKEVFSTTDVTKEWDGNVGGNPAPFGVYVWEADGFCISGTRLSKSGNVTLFR